MTRQEFIDDYNSWEALMEFNGYYDCCVLDDVYYRDDAFAEIEARARDLLEDYGWHDTYDFLEGVPWEAEYYVQDDDGEWMDIDDAYDFDEKKQDLLDIAYENDIWDDEDEEEDVTDEATEANDYWTFTMTDTVTVGAASELTEEVSLDEYIAAIQPKRPETTFSLDQLFCQPADVL